MSDTNLTIDRDDIEQGAFVKTVTSGGRLADDTIKAGIVEGIETEYNHVLDEEQTFVVLTDGEETHRINIKHFENNNSVRVTEYHVSDDENESDEDDDDAEAEVAADGGEDISELVSNDEIESAIEQHDDTGRPGAYTVTEVREVLDDINADIIDHWDLHQDALDDGAYEIVHEDDDVIVLAEGGHFWSEQLDAMGLGDEHGILQSIVTNLQHVAARNHCDYNWSASTPVVVEKTDGFRAGEQNVLREIARRTDEYGSVARAVDSLATETYGWSKSNWASLTGRNPSTVTRTTDN